VKLAQLEALSDPQMVNELATHMTRSSARASRSRPFCTLCCRTSTSITLTRCGATVTDTADGEKRIAEIYGGKWSSSLHHAGFDWRGCARSAFRSRRQEHDWHGADEARHFRSGLPPGSRRRMIEIGSPAHPDGAAPGKVPDSPLVRFTSGIGCRALLEH
jgi:hypothetical protein